MIVLARGFCNAIREAKHETALTPSLLCRSAREGVELIACFNTARRIAGAPAIASPRQSARIGFINGDYLVDAVHKSARDRIFEHAGAFCGCTLNDKGIAGQRMNRERADIHHTTARVLICAAVPLVGCLLRLVGKSLSQRVELEPHLLPEHRLRIGKEWPRRIDAARQWQCAKDRTCDDADK